LYNLHHSQARNVIERIFGVVKKRYSILRETNDFPQGTQAKIVSACGVIHNFIHTFDPNDELDPLEDEANALQAQDGGDHFSGGTGDIHGTETHRATEKRETIAQAMWLGYQAELQRRM